MSAQLFPDGYDISASLAEAALLLDQPIQMPEDRSPLTRQQFNHASRLVQMANLWPGKGPKDSAEIDRLMWRKQAHAGPALSPSEKTP